MADIAFIIGIEEYINESLPKVRYAEADAISIGGALEALGFTVDTLLLSKDATKTNIEHKLTEVLATLTKHDRFLLYYAGHGFAEVGHTVLSSAETTTAAVAQTGVSLAWIMESLDQTPCTRWMFFLDACHAGAVNLHNERSVTDSMSEKELKQFFKDADHKVCFAACKFSQKSRSATAIKHGIWTYHILKAMRGEEPKALLKGKYLTAHSLQDYLLATVPVAVKALLTGDHKQTPVMYGSLTNNFEVADLAALIAAQKASSPANASYKGAAYKFAEVVSIKSLTGFRKGSHRVPHEVASYANDFVQRVAAPDIKERVDERFKEIRDGLGLKRLEIRKDDDRIITKDFEYAIWCEQDDEEPSDAVIYEELSNVSPESMQDEAFNNLFIDSFDEMVLSPKKKIDIPALIDTIEALDSAEISVTYDSDCEDCQIRIKGDRTQLHFTPTSVTVRIPAKTNPAGLIVALAGAGQQMVAVAGPSVAFLS